MLLRRDSGRYLFQRRILLFWRLSNRAFAAYGGKRGCGPTGHAIPRFRFV